MSGFAEHVRKRDSHVERADKATLERWRVVRHDGVTMGGSPSREVAERLAAVLCAGRPGYAHVVGRGGR